jgi:DNA primase
MLILPDKLDEIASANDIIDVMSSYIHVKKRGKSFLALCPFHPDKNPSMSISQEKQVYHCFSCGASGNVFKFLENYEKITFAEAATKLAERAGIKIHINKSKPDVSNEIALQYEINKQAAKYFYHVLKGLTGSEREFVFNYLKDRGIKARTIIIFGIGFAEKSWNSLYNHFAEDNMFRPEDIESAGLIIKSEKENAQHKYYDRFRGRLIFPIFNESGKVVAFGGRQMFEDDKLAKYINSPESKVYNKSRILYGLNFARDYIRALDYVILVEGYFDVISLHQAGIRNVVASSGTALTEEQIKLISRYTNNIVLIYDSDLAGIKASKRGIELVLEAGLELNIVSLPDGEDPDSYVRNHGKEKFEAAINTKKSVINFIADLYEKENKLSSVNDKTAFIKEIISFVVKMPDKIKQAFYIQELAKLHKLYESDLREELLKQSKELRPKQFVQNKRTDQKQNVTAKRIDKNAIPSCERELIELILNCDQDVLDYIFDKIDLSLISNIHINVILKEFWEDYINEGKIDVSKVMNKLQDEEALKLLAELSSDKFQLSAMENDSRYTLLANPSKTKTNYMKFALDLLRKFIEVEYDIKRDEMKKTQADPLELLNLAKEKKKKLESLTL